MKPLCQLLRSSKPPPEGFRFRPRQRPYRAMVWLLTVMQVTLIVGLVWLFLSFRAEKFLEPPSILLWLLLPALFMPLLISLSLHASWGARAGEVVAPLQLWRWPKLRELPELPPLKLWRLALMYGLPIAIIGTLAWLMGVDSSLKTLQSSTGDKYVVERWAGRGWVQVSCTEVPLKHTEQSLCYMPTRAVDGRAAETALKEWLTNALTTYELGEQPERVVRPLPDLNMQRGGGIMASRINLTLPHDTAFKTTDHAYALGFLARDPKAEGPLPSGWTEQQARWIERQPFSGVLVLTPQ